MDSVPSKSKRATLLYKLLIRLFASSSTLCIHWSHFELSRPRHFLAQYISQDRKSHSGERTGVALRPLSRTLSISSRSMIFVPASRCQPLLPVPKQVFPRSRINAKASAGIESIVSSAYVDGRSRTTTTISGLTATFICKEDNTLPRRAAATILTPFMQL